MRVLVTGSSGFLGSHLVEALCLRGALPDARGTPQPVRELVLVDVVAGDPRLTRDPRVQEVLGDASDPALLARVLEPGVDAVFALGATLTADAEADFARGLEVNLLGMLRLLEALRQRPPPAPRLVFTSSIAAFGGPLPELVDDAQPLTPETSYGTHKAVNELLLSDYARRGFVDGRALRLPIVLVRPSGQGRSISDRLAALVREPLAGRDVACPLRADTRVPIASARAVTDALLALYALPASAFGATRALNLCSLSVRIGEIADAVQALGVRRAGTAATGRVRFEPDPALQAIVDRWPRRFESARARALGLAGDASIEAILAHYVHDYLERGTPA